MHPDTLIIQGLIICGIGGLVYTVFMIVIFVKAGGSSIFKSDGKTKTRQRDQYWLEEDGRPSRHGPGQSIPVSPISSVPMSPLPDTDPDESRDSQLDQSANSTNHNHV
jgi:hypothetical protein